MTVDWAGWAIFGLVATVTLTGLMVAAQLAGLSRMDIPLLLGTLFTDRPDHARLFGFVVHLVNGQVFALCYAGAFSLMGRSGWWLGMLFGLWHGVLALTVLVPLLSTFHPRIASERAGPQLAAALEPPGALALHYGREAPLVALAAHVTYGWILGAFLAP